MEINAKGVEKLYEGPEGPGLTGLRPEGCEWKKVLKIDAPFGRKGS